MTTKQLEKDVASIFSIFYFWGVVLPLLAFVLAVSGVGSILF